MTIEMAARPARHVAAAPVHIGPVGVLAKIWNILARRIEDRRTLHKLYQLDAHILRDMGFDPDAIYRAREGAIGDMSALRRNDF
jgi:uncharacterized protein YjiS (DUF1127 family)